MINFIYITFKTYIVTIIFSIFSVKAMLLIIDCKKKITWKKFDHIQNGSLVSSEGKVVLEEKELLKAVESGEGMEKAKDEVKYSIYLICL